MRMEKSWEVNYPNGLIKHIDLFREKLFQYPVYDKVVDEYIKKNKRAEGNKMISLGSGTGHHEEQLSKLGYDVIGFERNEESLNLAKEAATDNKQLEFLKCDFLNENEVDTIMSKIGKVDIVVLLLIPISANDYAKAANIMHKWINPGGVFITDNFGYVNEIDISRLSQFSDIEVADDRESGKYAVRLNYYEFKNNIVNWDAIYLYNEDGKLNMARDHDILDVIPEIKGVDPFDLSKDKFELLETYRVDECEDCINPPNLYEYLIGWRIK